MVEMYVKKIWSLSPDEYMFITLKEATARYEQYIQSWDKANKERPESKLYFKTFEEWLDTEI